MGTLALMLKERGHIVTGSDTGAYPPMSDLLARAGIPVNEGYRAELVRAADVTIIGNAVTRGNPEVEEVLSSRLRHFSMAQAIREFFLQEKEVIAVTGTHGKTTTTALLAHIMTSAGMDPSFLVGGVARNFDSNYRLGTGKHFIIEGDEYDSAFFEKVPKFSIYRPHNIVITSLEFDHADIYRDLAEIELWFKRLVRTIPSNGAVVYSASYPSIPAVLQGSTSVLRSFGSAAADYTWRMGPAAGGGSRAEISVSGPEGTVTALTSLIGRFNCENVAAASAMALLMGVEPRAIESGIAGFTGVRRRQELIYERDRVAVFEDFAHHPTAIRGVLSAVRERFPDRTIWALYEPRSATSRRNVFQKELPEALTVADRILIKTIFKPGAIDEADRLDVGLVRDDCNAMGKSAHVFDSVDGIIGALRAALDPSERHAIVIMSNGGFDGIYTKIIPVLDGLLARPSGAN